MEVSGTTQNCLLSPSALNDSQMSKRKFLTLLAIYSSYLLLGATVFYYLENSTEQKQLREQTEVFSLCHQEVNEINLVMDDLKQSLNGTNETCPGADNTKEEVIKVINYWKDFQTGNCSWIFSHHNNTNLTQPKDCKWSFTNSFIFSFISVTTIGYGNQAPATSGGKVVFLFYCFIGVPLSGILVTSLGAYFAFFGEKVSRIKEKVKSFMKEKPAKYTFILIEVSIFFICGMLVFLFLPAALFVFIECHEGSKWRYIDGLYYSFVTLSTIGFGDFIAGNDNNVLSNTVYKIYQIGIVVWTLFGLGYIYMVITIIQEGMEKQVLWKIIETIRRKKRKEGSKPVDETKQTIKLSSIKSRPSMDAAVQASHFAYETHANLVKNTNIEEKFSFAGFFSSSKWQTNSIHLHLLRYLHHIDQRILEETTLAEFLSAIENVHETDYGPGLKATKSIKVNGGSKVEPAIKEKNGDDKLMMSTPSSSPSRKTRSHIL